MVYDYRIKFQENPPTIPFILERLTDRTGLMIEYDDDTWGFATPDKKHDVPLYIDGDTIIIVMISEPRITYLLGVILLTLKELGGSCPAYIPDWASKKWAEIKDDFNTLPNFSLPNVNIN